MTLAPLFLSVRDGNGRETMTTAAASQQPGQSARDVAERTSVLQALAALMERICQGGIMLEHGLRGKNPTIAGRNAFRDVQLAIRFEPYDEIGLTEVAFAGSDAFNGDDLMLALLDLATAPLAVYAQDYLAA